MESQSTSIAAIEQSLIALLSRRAGDSCVGSDRDMNTLLEILFGDSAAALSPPERFRSGFAPGLFLQFPATRSQWHQIEPVNTTNALTRS
jgi:hypothetical protein